MDRKQAFWHVLVLATIFILLLAEFVYMSSAPELVDEGANWKQIVLFLNREMRLTPGLNMLPGYHALIAAVMLVFQKAGIYSARFLTTLLSFTSVIVFYLLAWKVCGRPSLVKTLQYSFFPLFFPFFPLVYTDILAMELVLLAFYLVLWKRYTLSGIVGFLSILARTNNIAWFAYLYAFIYIENFGLNLRVFAKSLKKTWIYLLGFGIIAAFLILNHGIALTDKDMQPLGGLYSGNIFYLLFLFAFLFLPLNLVNIPKIVGLLKEKRWILLIGLITFIGYLLTFQSTHPYNQSYPNYFLRNQLLMIVTGSLALKSAFFIPAAWSMLSIGVTKLRTKNFYWLYPFTVLSLVPFWLIEPRYAFVPLSLFLVFKEEQSPLVEWVTVGLYIVVCILMLSPLRSESFFI